MAMNEEQGGFEGHSEALLHELLIVKINVLHQ